MPAAPNHRARLLDTIARARAGDRDALATLAAGDAAARWLAAAAGFGDRDGDRTLALLADPSRRVRGKATVLVALACTDDQAVAALTLAWSTRNERRLLRRLAARGRTSAIDRFLDQLAADGHTRELVDALSFGSAAAVARHLPTALERPSQRLWRGLAGHHPEVLGAVLLARWGEHAGEADPVTRQLTDAHHPMIAARAPDRGLELAACLLARAIEPTAATWAPLVRLRPGPTVALAIRHAARLPAGLLESRARELSPALLADIVAHAPALLGAYEDWLRTASPARQQAMATAWLGAHARWPLEGAALLRYLPATPAREVAYQAWSRAARDRDGVIAPSALRSLPADLAVREGRRHLHEVVVLATDPARRITGYARYLPWAELDQALAELRGHPEGDTRAVALQEQLSSIGLYPDDAALPVAALALVTARKFEQDPVRRVMLMALADWPRRVWRAAHLPAVQQILRDMLDAADCSVITAVAGERIVIRMFAVDPAWAATQLTTLIKERGTLYDQRLGARLTADEVVAAAPALLQIVDAWLIQERFAWVASLVDSLGRHLAHVPGLAERVAQARFTATIPAASALVAALARHAPALHLATLPELVAHLHRRRWYAMLVELATSHGVAPGHQPRTRNRRRDDLPAPLADELLEIVRTGPLEHHASAVEVLAARAPAAFDDALAPLLTADPSLLALAPVRRWAHRHRQELLTPYLAGAPVTGRRATGATGWLFHFRTGTHRWTADQTATYADTLDAVVADADRDTPAVLAAVTTLASLDWCDQRALCARAADPRPAVQEKAIRVLARCDAGQGVPTLLACLDDHRARFAIYGLRRALFEMAPARAVELLADAPLRKVTVAKEVVRLLGELRTPTAVARLDQLAAGPLHRDVRIALLRALWDHLDRDETWAVYARAVDDPDWITASRLADIPADRLTAATDRRLAALLARVVARPEPEARIDLLRRAATVAVADRDRAFLAACRARLASPYDTEVTAAMGAVMARSTEADVDAVGATLAALTADPRALHVAVAALVAHDVRSRASWQHLARAAAEAVIGDRRWANLAIDATAALADGPALVAVLARVAAIDAVDVDAVAAARAGLGRLRPEELSATVATLAGHPHPGLRRIAVAGLTRDAGAGRGWTPDRLTLLAALRADAEPSVAGAAARVWPPREDDPPA
ncbi:MAG: hypothetical protein R3B06_06450 [Kofleriaceae bacterium]